MTSRSTKLLAVYGAFLFAGTAGLGCQVVWARLFLAGIGHEMPALVGIVAAYMCGLALGAGALDRTVAASRRPGCWFAALQVVAGAWGLCAAALIPWLCAAVPGVLGTNLTPGIQWGVAFVLPAVVLLPATAALGATFAAMERTVTIFARPGRHVAALYAVNTAGAAFGVVLAAGWLMPQLGLRLSALVFAGLALLAAAVSLPLVGVEAAASPGKPPSTVAQSTLPWPWSRLAFTLAICGMLGIGYQLVVVHVLAQVFDNTIYTYAILLTVYLTGTALGAAAYRRWCPDADFRPVLVALCGLLSLTCLVGVMVLGHGGGVMENWRAAGSGAWTARVRVEIALAAAVFLPPTLVMGAAWSHLVQAARRPQGGIGLAVAVNALGCAVAPLLIGVLLLPAVGAKWILTAMAWGYLALSPRPRGWQWAWLAAPLGLTALTPATLRVLELPPGADVIAWREGLLGSVAVIREPDRSRTLRVDNRFQMGGTGSVEMAARHAHFPLLMHPGPKRALVLGVGTGLTLGATTLHPDLEADGVELVPDIVAVMPLFEPENRQASRHPRLRLHTADARRFVVTSRDVYDVVVGDLFHPARDGAALLYTREHFAAIRRRLAPGGVFVQWLPLHQMGDATLRTVVRTFLDVFPESHAWLLQFNVDVPVLGLAGYSASPRLHPQWIETRTTGEPLLAELRGFAVGDTLRFLGHWLAGPVELRAWAGTGPLNTDDHPRVLFLAGRQPASTPVEIHARLSRLLQLRSSQLAGFVVPAEGGGTGEFADRWRQYLEARDVYLEGLIHEAEGRRDRAVTAFVESARRSREFTSGYARCLTLASLLAPNQPAAARALLERLVEAQPAIPVARQMLNRLGNPQPEAGR